MWEKTKIEPQALATKPDLPSHLLESLIAFNWLHPRRMTEMGSRPISIRDVLDYIEYFEIDYDVDDKERLLSHISAMDTAYVEHKAKLKAKPQDGRNAKSQG